MSQGIETLLKMDAFSLSLERRCFPSSSEGGGGVPTQYREWRGLRKEERRVRSEFQTPAPPLCGVQDRVTGLIHHSLSQVIAGLRRDLCRAPGFLHRPSRQYNQATAFIADLLPLQMVASLPARC